MSINDEKINQNWKTMALAYSSALKNIKKDLTFEKKEVIKVIDDRIDEAEQYIKIWWRE